MRDAGGKGGRLGPGASALTLLSAPCMTPARRANKGAAHKAAGAARLRASPRFVDRDRPKAGAKLAMAARFQINARRSG